MIKKLLLLIMVPIVCFISGCAIVEDGEVGIKKTLGNIKDEPLGTGIKIFIPIVSSVDVWSVKSQEIKETAKVPSAEGLISTLEVSLIYSIPPKEAVHIRETIGRNYMDQILEPYLRETIRLVVSGYPVKALFSEQGRGEISIKMIEELKSKLDKRGFMIEDVLLRDVQLPKTFSESIEQKLKAEQESLQKEFELQKAKKDAEIEVARARGAAKANEIIAKSITSEYIQYLWVQGLNDGHSEVIYVPTEANLPILEAGRKLIK